VPDIHFQELMLAAVPLIFAITVHEVAHGWVAKLLGDATAASLGRLTLNPIKHIDPIGTILVPFTLVLLGSKPIGWAKPVPVNWQNLHNPKRDMIFVALAGPAANLLMALAWLCVALLVVETLTRTSDLFFLYTMAFYGVFVNILLMILNLLPILPLDGGRVLAGLLPDRAAYQYSRLEPIGLILVIGLFVSGYLGPILLSPVSQITSFLYHMAGLPQ